MIRLSILVFMIVMSAIVLGAPLTAAAQTGDRYTPSLYGPLGLNTVPSARMDATGTVRAGLSTSDPYVHTYAQVQIAAALQLGLRQSAAVSGLNDDPDHLYPGVDLKLRLWPESEWVPEISAGLIGGLGHRRMATEYLALSKRWHDFDFTGGLGWGRLGEARFENGTGDELPNEPSDWFSGDPDFFGGIEYFPPWASWTSFKADIAGDDYEAETTIGDFDRPSRWSFGLSLRPRSWINAGLALIGGDKIMGSLSIQAPLKEWPRRAVERVSPLPLAPRRSGELSTDAMEQSAVRENIILHGTRAEDGHRVWTALIADDLSPLPFQTGRAARHMSAEGGGDAETFSIIPVRNGLYGPPISLARTDLERAAAHNNGSAAELWRSAEIGEDLPPDLYGGPVARAVRGGLPWALPSTLRLTLAQDVSLSEEDSGILYRTSFMASERRALGAHTTVGGALRINLADNLDQLDEFRPAVLLPVRGDIDRFALNTVTFDRLYLSWMTTLRPGIHAAVTAGYLEEMFSGLGGEVLYRPFDRTFAVGAELWAAARRDPDTRFAMGLRGDRVLTGHLNAWYEIPDTDLTLHARAGRYLGGDYGGSFAVIKQLDNGIAVRGFVTATDSADFDVFGGTTHVYSGLELSLPLGDLPAVPAGSRVAVRAAPQGRNAGQALDTPMPLYDITNDFSLRQIAAQWGEAVR